MKRWLLALIAANLLVVVALAFTYPHLMVSPGPLAGGHVELASDCFACHAPLRGAASPRCIACHALPDIGVRTTQGAPLVARTVKTLFHQELIEQDCIACHSDHQGLKPARRSRKAFSHALLRAPVRERCESCHTRPKDKLHRDLGAGCGQCHQPERWKPATFDHDKRFVLDRDHNTKCVTCHTNDDTSRYTCYGCHEHSPDKIRAKHLKEGVRDFENCAQCHLSASEEPKGKGSGGKRERD